MVISGWGKFPKTNSNLFYPKNLDDLVYDLNNSKVISRGMGRSYGDSAISDNIIQSNNFCKIIDFNEIEGIVNCEGGTILKDLLKVIVPKGWFLPVTPGSSFVTIGGAIASDVHGKNQHLAGNFSDHIISIDLMTGNGKVLQISKFNYADLFQATCGGMGLTGVIVSARIKLKPIKSSLIEQKIYHTKNLDELDEKFKENLEKEYSVAWIDGLNLIGKNNKSILIVGEHSNIENLHYNEQNIVNFPPVLVKPFFNDFFMKYFNKLTYYKNLFFVKNKVNLNSFFYPLDKVSSWNLFYGEKGFIQYQFVLPYSENINGIKKILKKLNDNNIVSSLIVLKLFNRQNNNFLSFPIKGYTLTMDFKVTKKLINFLPILDDLILSMGGRIYLAKDALMSELTFKKSYPKWVEFQEVREKYGAKEKFCSMQSIRLGLN